MRQPTTICLETSSMCNRTCGTCIRNSHPDRNAVKSWFEEHFMSMRMIHEFIRQYNGFKSQVCLNYYNEPLMDPRIVDIAKMLKKGRVGYLYICTNGDFLTKELAEQLDGVLDRITVSLYCGRKKRRLRAPHFESMFKKTRVWIKGTHMETHFNPKGTRLIERICGQQRSNTRLVVNHKGQYLMCCDDLTNEFGFGTFPETTLKEYWFGEKHSKIMGDLQIPGGRKKYKYCQTCPRKW
jgi:hypothetical protein